MFQLFKAFNYNTFQCIHLLSFHDIQRKLVKTFYRVYEIGYKDQSACKETRSKCESSHQSTIFAVSSFTNPSARKALGEQHTKPRRDFPAIRKINENVRNWLLLSLEKTTTASSSRSIIKDPPSRFAACLIRISSRYIIPIATAF